MTVSRDFIIQQNPIATFLERAGIRLTGSTPKLRAFVCPLKEHKRGHFCVEINVESNLWHCHDCSVGGSIIDWVMHSKGCTAIQAMDTFMPGGGALAPRTARKPLDGVRQRPVQQNDSTVKISDSDIVEIYPYTDEIGRLLFEVLRLKPLPNGKKRFRQRHPDGKGGYVDNMEGVTRVIFQLPKVLLTRKVAIVEGEKDALTVTKYGRGVIGTCNPMGAGGDKWKPAYAQYFEDKDVYVFQDNDEDGPAHADKETQSVVPVANSVKRPQFSAIYKDVTDYLESFPEEQRENELEQLFKSAVPIKEAPPVYLVHEFEEVICQDFKRNGEHFLDIGKFLPSLGKIVGEPLQQGDLAVFLGDVGIGKTAILQALARSAHPLPTIFFEMELGKRQLWIRTIQEALPSTYREVYNQYHDFPDERHADGFQSLKHIAFCWRSGLTPSTIEDWTIKTALKFDQPIVLVFVDYIGLIEAKGKTRYEKVSNAAESLKKIAGNTNTIVIASGQIHRKGDETHETRELHLHDARDSGSIEASAQLLIGCYRAEQNPRTRMIFKVLKNTKGRNNIKTEVNFNGKTMRFSDVTPDQSAQQV